MDQSTRTTAPVESVEQDPVDVFVDILVKDQPKDTRDQAPRYKAWLRSRTLEQLDAFIAKLVVEPPQLAGAIS